MKVKEAMHTGVNWVAPDTSVRDIARRMRDEDIGAVPVGENDRLIGMVTDRDITCRAVIADSQHGLESTARDVMTESIVYCSENQEVSDAVRVMEEKKIRRLPVINDDKRMVGMLSLGDVAQAASLELSGEVVKAVANHHP